MFARGVEKRVIFLDDRDRRVYVRLLADEIRRAHWIRLAHCLMDNHVHLIVQTVEPTLSEGMHRLHTHYARYFNDRYDRVGHLFQGRFGSSRLWTPAAVAAKVDYVEQNPVAAGLCARAEDWPWSSSSRPLAR